MRGFIYASDRILKILQQASDPQKIAPARKAIIYPYPILPGDEVSPPPRGSPHPDRPVSLVIDTDTFNEVDDQFALASALRPPEAMQVEAIHAAPFHNNRSTGPAEGMGGAVKPTSTWHGSCYIDSVLGGTAGRRGTRHGGLHFLAHKARSYNGRGS